MSKIISKIKKLNIFFTAVITGIAGVFLFSSCVLRERDADYRIDIYRTFKITVPEEWEQIYFNAGSLGGFHGDGTAYYVFAVSGYDEEFFDEFSDIKDEKFEIMVENEIESSFSEEDDGRLDYHGPIDPQYLFDLDQPYEWFIVKIKDDTLMMIYQSRRLYAFASYL